MCVCIYVCVHTRGSEGGRKQGWTDFIYGESSGDAQETEKQSSRVKTWSCLSQGPEIPKSSNATQQIRDP